MSDERLFLLITHYSVVYPFRNRPPERRKAVEPFGGLKDDLKSWFDELRVGRAATADRRLIRECADGFEAALHRHQSKLARELVRVQRVQPAPPSLFQKKEAVRAHFSERRQFRLAV